MITPKRTHSMGNTSRIFTTFARALKQSEKHLLLSTTYGLNNSFTKKIVVGLGLRTNDEFEPVIKLINNSSGGVFLKPSTWTTLSDFLDTLSEYLETDPFTSGQCGQWYLDNLELGDCTIVFTTAHGTRAIRFDTPLPTEESTADAEDSANSDHEPIIKRQKLYQPSIVMQKPTFDGLKSVFVLVDEQIRRLQRLAHDVNQCKELYVKYITEQTKITSSNITVHRIKQMIGSEHEAAKEIIKTQLEPAFVENYLDITLLEIAKLYPSCIAVEVKQAIEET